MSSSARRRVPSHKLQALSLLTAVVLSGCSSSSSTPSTHSISSSSSSDPSSVSSVAFVPSVSSEHSDSPLPIPDKITLSVPFAPQAPHANWDALHEEACEEASLIMVHRYLEKQPLTLDEMEGDILAMIAWENRNGYAHDVTAAEIAQIARDYYGHSARVITGDDVTVDALKRELAAGNPVIIPAQGQFLGNPYFSGEGPPYHMLVLIGYRGDTFITNDPGTRRGQKYEYPADIIMNAIHDWTGDKETVRDGQKAVVIVEK